MHLDLRCVALAERRRAFGRALRLTSTPDTDPVREHVEQAAQRADQHDPHD